MCNCIQEYNDALLPIGLELATNIDFNHKTHGMVVVLVIPTRKINRKNPKATDGFVAMNYCPFCGEKEEEL